MHGLATDPAVGTVDLLRLRFLRGGLGSVLGWVTPSWRIGTALLFGLRTLAAAPGGQPGWAALGHGYWWCRVPQEAFDAFEGWVTGLPDGAGIMQASETPVHEDTGVSGTAGGLSAELLRWRLSSSYAQPLLDDWGDTGARDLPPAWTELVTTNGGLEDFAVFGLQVRMVVADVDDGTGDLYLAMGAAGTRVGGRDAEAEARGGESQSPAGNGTRTREVIATKDDFIDDLEHLSEVERPVRWMMDSWPSGMEPPREESVDEWRTALSTPRLTAPAVEQAQLASLQRWLPDLVQVPAALRDVVSSPLDAKRNGHRGLLEDWHARWHKVLAHAYERHGVEDPAQAEVLRLPQVGFFPAMRVALDALCGQWGPLAATLLSWSGVVEAGWPPAVVPRLQVIQRKGLGPLRKSPERVHVTSLATSFLLSRSAEEGAAYRTLLGIDIGSKTLRPAGAGLLEAVAAFGSVALTGYAATYRGDGRGSQEVQVDRSTA